MQPIERVSLFCSAENIEQYVGQQGFVGGSTTTKKPPTIQVLRLTDLSSLKKMVGLVIPGVSSDRKVYYTTLKGPFNLNHNLPMSVVTTLLPSANNWAVLSKLPALQQVKDLNSLPLLNDLENNLCAHNRQYIHGKKHIYTPLK